MRKPSEPSARVYACNITVVIICYIRIFIVSYYTSTGHQGPRFAAERCARLQIGAGVGFPTWFHGGFSPTVLILLR
jgi:hypothetical protein